MRREVSGECQSIHDATWLETSKLLPGSGNNKGTGRWKANQFLFASRATTTQPATIRTSPRNFLECAPPIFRVYFMFLPFSRPTRCLETISLCLRARRRGVVVLGLRLSDPIARVCVMPSVPMGGAMAFLLSRKKTQGDYIGEEAPWMWNSLHSGAASASLMTARILRLLDGSRAG